jgi:PKHD-type hydroxylase
MFLHLPQVLTASQLNAVRTALNGKDAPWVDGRVTAGHQSASAKRNQQLEESSPLARA